MILPIEGEGLLEVDVYLNVSGGISFEPLYVNQESEGAFCASFPDLVQEFLTHQINHETGRIENAQVDAAFELLDGLKKAVALLEDAIYD